MVYITKWNTRSRRKKTGALLNRIGKKKKYQRVRGFMPSHVGKGKKKIIRTSGGGKKIITMSSDIANIMIKGKAQKAKIITVKENSADSQFIRRNIITKGAIIETDLGMAKVTSRPGRDGTINAVLMGEKTAKKT